MILDLSESIKLQVCMKQNHAWIINGNTSF